MYHPLSSTFARCVKNVYDVSRKRQVPHISTTTWSIKQAYLDKNNPSHGTYDTLFADHSPGKLVSKLVGKVFPQINGMGVLISNPESSDPRLVVQEVWTVKSTN